VFHPYRSDQHQVLMFADWHLKFCVSVSWRVLTYLSRTESAQKLRPNHSTNVAQALATWERFLKGEISNPGRFEQHLLPVGGIESTNVPNLPPNINRYLARSAHIDLVTSEAGFCASYAKMGPFLLFGFASPPTEKWKGTRVPVSGGAIRPTNYELPRAVLEYVIASATSSGTAMASMSVAQQQKVDASVTENIEKFKNSELLKAIDADVRMFGTDAALRKS